MIAIIRPSILKQRKNPSKPKECSFKKIHQVNAKTRGSKHKSINNIKSNKGPTIIEDQKIN